MAEMYFTGVNSDFDEIRRVDKLGPYEHESTFFIVETHKRAEGSKYTSLGKTPNFDETRRIDKLSPRGGSQLLPGTVCKRINSRVEANSFPVQFLKRHIE